MGKNYEKQLSEYVQLSTCFRINVFSRALQANQPDLISKVLDLY